MKTHRMACLAAALLFMAPCAFAGTWSITQVQVRPVPRYWGALDKDDSTCRAYAYTNGGLLTDNRTAWTEIDWDAAPKALSGDFSWTAQAKVVWTLLYQPSGASDNPSMVSCGIQVRSTGYLDNRIWMVGLGQASVKAWLDEQTDINSMLFCEAVDYTGIGGYARDTTPGHPAWHPMTPYPFHIAQAPETLWKNANGTYTAQVTMPITHFARMVWTTPRGFYTPPTLIKGNIKVHYRMITANGQNVGTPMY